MTETPFRAELAQHIASLRRFALALSRDETEAEDLVQECLARAIAGAATWRPDAPLRPWLFRILHNVHISNLRRQRVRTAWASAAQRGESAEADQALKVEVEQTLAALGRLPEAQRAAVLLVAVDGLRYDEAAQRLGLPMGTFMSRLARGREALRTVMDGRRRPDLRVVDKP